MSVLRRIADVASTLSAGGGVEEDRKIGFDADPDRTNEMLALLRELNGKVDAQIQKAGENERAFANHRRTMDWYASTGAFEIQESTLALMGLLRPCRVKNIPKIRLGSENDGGYVMLDDFSGVDTAFSFGVERNADWDTQVADRGLTVYQFDHSIDHPPVVDKRLIWEKKMIAPTAGEETESISSLVRRHDKGNTRPNIILKMDIEGAEWDAINATPADELRRFSQIVCELHSFDYLGENWYREKVTPAIRKLTEGYCVVHVHANNYCGFANISGVVVPMIVEFTFANRALYQLEPCAEVFPGPLDKPCDRWRPDLYLGQFDFQTTTVNPK